MHSCINKITQGRNQKCEGFRKLDVHIKLTFFGTYLEYPAKEVSAVIYIYICIYIGM